MSTMNPLRLVTGLTVGLGVASVAGVAWLAVVADALRDLDPDVEID